jgi:di/tricarboxylate transporter
MAALMIVTAFLSMWINNASATLVMLPAALVIIDELQQHSQTSHEKAQTVIQQTIPIDGKNS